MFPRGVFKRKQFFALILLVGCFFLLYQIISVNQLGKEMALRQFRKNVRAYEKADDFFELHPRKKVKTDNQVQPEVLESNQLEQHRGSDVRGVLPQHQKLYSNATSKIFHCALGQREIPFENVNDDYCDCDDGSDEPSTSACANGRFYCAFQKANILTPEFVPSSRVNDGICDCCDGSDEWNLVQLPSHAVLSEALQVELKVDQVPCRNRCKEELF